MPNLIGNPATTHLQLIHSPSALGFDEGQGPRSAPPNEAWGNAWHLATDGSGDKVAAKLFREAVTQMGSQCQGATEMSEWVVSKARASVRRLLLLSGGHSERSGA